MKYKKPSQKLDEFFDDMNASGVESLVIMMADPDSDLDMIRHKGSTNWKIGACTHASDVFRHDALDSIVENDEEEEE